MLQQHILFVDNNLDWYITQKLETKYKFVWKITFLTCVICSRKLTSTFLEYWHSVTRNETTSINCISWIKKVFSSPVCKWLKYISFLSNLHWIWQKIVVDQKIFAAVVLWYDLNAYSISIPYGQHRVPAVSLSLLSIK